jgi:ABC-type branched-subunit amino acid transport system substrate-binding protein
MTMRARRLRRAFALCAVVAIAATACGDDDDTTTPDATTTTAAEGSGDGATTTTAAEEMELEFEAASGDVRGFDGTTIKVASIGIKSQLPGVEFGAQARIKRFNDTGEIPGVKIEYVEFAEDRIDPATTLSEARRLVTSEEVFALVGDVSATNPGDYFEQQGVPYFGYAFDFTYCSDEPDDSLWGFGFTGCLVPQHPKEMPDTARHLYQYVKEKTGKEHPTAALFSSDSESGKNSAKFQTATVEGAGFEVVFAEGNVPLPPVADYTPYVQQLLTADNGNPPDVMICLLSADCIPIYAQVQANNYQGIFHHTLYSDLLVGLMEGTTSSTFAVPFNTKGNAALDQVIADIKAVKSDQALETGSAAGYFSTDMFIQALKTVAEQGTEYITPANVRLAAAHQTWEIEGLVGPTRYPESTVTSTPQCSALVFSDGSAWQTVAEYDCSEKRHPFEG